MAQARKVNWFAIWVSVGIVVVLGLLAWLVVAMNSASQPVIDNEPTASNVEISTGAILVGDAEDRLDTYVDFMCPICNQFEQVYGESIQGLVDDGTATLGIHPIAILDRYSQGTEYSTRSANAMYCVVEEDEDAALPYMQALFANQPAEQTAGLSDDELIAIAESVGVTGVDECVTDRSFGSYVTAMTENTPLQPGAQGIGTPTVAVNGEAIANSELPDAANLASLFE